MTDEKKNSWEEREELVNEDLRYAIKIKKIALARQELELEQEKKPSKYDENMERHMEYTKKHLDFMQKGEDRKKEMDAINLASCEDQRKQLTRIADSLEKLERFFIDKE